MRDDRTAFLLHFVLFSLRSSKVSSKDAGQVVVSESAGMQGGGPKLPPSLLLVCLKPVSSVRLHGFQGVSSPLAQVQLAPFSANPL